MALTNQRPELSCLDPDNYRKFFRALCWSGTRKYDKKPLKKVSKKERLRRLKAANILAVCHAPSLLGNPSQFAVYSTVRRSILARWKHLQGSLSELSDDSDSEDSVILPISKLPKITGIGLRTVFALISQARTSNSHFCEHALKALLDVLQGHAPEELSQEPTEMILNLHTMLVEVASGTGPNDRPAIPTSVTALSSSCLIALSVARGEAELILNAVGLLIMSPPELTEQNIVIPCNLTKLQRSVQSVILGAPVRNQWQQFGVPHQCLVTSFPVELPSSLVSGSGDLVVRSLVCDGSFLYIFTSKGLLKIGSGYGGSIKHHVYLYKPDFFASDRHGWMGHCKNKLYLRVGRKKTEVYEINKDTLEVEKTIRLDPGPISPVEPKSSVFSDGNHLGLVLLTNFDNLTIRMYNVDVDADRVENETSLTLISREEIKVHLLRRRTLAIGRSSFEEVGARRFFDFGNPIVTQLDDDDADPLTSIYAGQEFALLTTASGKVYYTGKGNTLGYKTAAANTLRWTLMKDTILSKNDAPNVKKGNIIQVAIGHEGVHAIMVLDNGSALFTGVARRGEDGDSSKHKRNPKPARPKKLFKVDGHYIIYAACNYGSTALVTRQGTLLLFGKDAQYCDSAGLVLGLRHERVIQVALGKAHAVVLASSGYVYTFGINNKGQCGREFGYTKEKLNTPRRININKEDAQLCQASHTWSMDYCRVCVLCRECTGFSTACHCSQLPNRVPREKCGCGEGDSGCTVCGICRVCAEALAASGGYDQTVFDMDEELEPPLRADTKCEMEQNPGKAAEFEAQPSTSEMHGDVNSKVNCLSPGRVPLPGGHRIIAVACGLHHTVVLTEHGEVLTFGSNQFGQLGTGDISIHHRIVRVRVPRASSITAGSNHTAVLTREGEVFTFGNYQKGSLGRPRKEESSHGDRCPIWHATPARVPRLGPRFSSKAVWVSASGDQTFIQVSQALIKTDTLFSSTITANNKSILILPNRPEHTFKCLTINKSDGSCNTWVGPEQVDFINTLACLDPLYDVLWCYQPKMRVMKCYNILAFDSHKLQRCCNNDPEDFSPTNESEYPNYGNMKRLEDFKNMEHFEVMCNNPQRPTHIVALSNTSILNQELAIPSSFGCVVTRMHAALHLLGCLDSLTYAHDNKIYQVECKRDNVVSTVTPVKDDYLTVNRFESHGGGWGYSGHSIEAIRFMCDTDILLGGYGLFGGRGDYTSKIKLYDIGLEGGEQEGDGEVIAESDEIVFECAPRDRFPVLFKTSIPLTASRWYVAWACVNGPSSDCGSSGQAMVINDDAGFHFKTSKKSNNGTDVNAGQIPCLLYNIAGPEHVTPNKVLDFGEPITVLSKTISRKVTVACFKSLITLLRWSWKTFKSTIMDTNGQIIINYQKLTVMKHHKRLVYVIRACLRLVKSYVNEIYPQNTRKRNSHEYMSYFEAIADVRNLIQTIMADPTPHCSMLSRRLARSKSSRDCYVTFALEMTTSILKEAHETTTACFHAFFPTPTLKWNHLCSLLYHASDGVVPANQIRELTATCAAMCAARSLRDVLQYVAPLTQTCIVNDNKRPDSKNLKEGAAKFRRSGHSLKNPPVPPRSNKEGQKSSESTDAKTIHVDWHLLDVIPKLLDITLIPIKEQMMTRPCGQHDHGEIRQYELLSEICCKLIARVVAELLHNASNIREDLDTTAVKHVITPSRFMRVNQSRSWNTGNGSPDAICFTVDRPGIMLVGVCVYGGTGNYEYSLELLHDVKLRSNEDLNPAHCWVSLEVAHGAFNGADTQHDMVQLKFDRAVPLKPELRYAIRLCNHGVRTANGDCGLPSVKGLDGTTFRFASCALSFNGTTLARGQIPSLVYYGTSRNTFNPMESTDSLVSALRTMMLRIATLVMDRSAELFCTLRNELTTEDLNRNSAVIQQSSAMNTLIPYIMASLELLDDPKNVIKILELVNKLIPHVAAMNLLMPTNEDLTTTTGNFYTWVECEHPYKQATVTNMRLLFPSEVAWIVLEIDPRSMTAQSEDTLTLYAVAGTPKQRCHCASEIRVADPPFRKRLIQLTDEGETEELGEENDSETPCMHYNCTYVSVTPKLSLNTSDWPLRGLLVPGNEVIFSLETASDYLTEFNNAEDDETRFGFRCLCVGYDDMPLAAQRLGLITLEMELTYIGSACAARLLSPNLIIPSLTFNTVPEPQSQSASGNVAAATEADIVQEDPGTAMILSRGLEISSPPTIHQIFDGQPLLRTTSTERQFLADFVAGTESTAGGRLATWLSPTARVEPIKCELKAPNTPPRPSIRLTIPIVLRDQYGDVVLSPAIKIEVVVQRVQEVIPRASCRISNDAGQTLPNEAYEPTVKETFRFQSITMMKAFQSFSFEEIRHASGTWGEVTSSSAAFSANGRVPAERLLVRLLTDGTYIASWVPRSPGNYVCRCTFDDLPSPQELTIQVVEDMCEGASHRAVQAGGSLDSLMPIKTRRFTMLYSAGLRIRASPSLQSEELSQIPPGADVDYIEEVVNKDGTWVRLSEDSAKTYADGCAGVAWCLQHHRHLDRELLEAVEPSSPESDGAGPSGLSDSQDERHFSPQEEDHDDDEDDELDDDRKFPFSVRCDLSDDSNGSSSPFMFGSEPSKRARSIRSTLGVSPSKGVQRRGNGNTNNWRSPRKHQSNENFRDFGAIMEDELDQDPDSDSDVKSVSRLNQIGTQTSPDRNNSDFVSAKHLNVDHLKVDSPKRGGEINQSDPSASCSRACNSALPTSSIMTRTTPPPPKKHAISPSQAECIRAVFAATLWHEGVVHDAIACAAFLKFHPQLPKQGARVVTRQPHNVSLPRPQRHSVEVFNAGHYLRIHPTTLEALTRSGDEASSSRSQKSALDVPIREEEAQPSCSRQNSIPSVVNVLPPALRALVALWDALCDSNQLSVATDKLKKEIADRGDNDNSSRPSSDARGIIESPDSSLYRAPNSVRCDLCNTYVPPPLAAHMRNAHPGCRVPTVFGYDRAGAYREADNPTPTSETPSGLCGQLAQVFQLWYIFCIKCREKAMKELNTTKQLKTKSERDSPYVRIELPPEVDHNVIRDNAMFLLDLAPITNSESVNITPYQESSTRSPPTPPGSVWLPAPPFQSLQAFKTTRKANDEMEAARYHSLGRPPMSSNAALVSAFGIPNAPVGSQWPKVQRSMSMGQAGDRDFVNSAYPPLNWNERAHNTDALSGAGSSLLAQPSAALQRLVGCGSWDAAGRAVSAFETPNFDTENLIGSPVMMFVLAKRDLHEFRQKMDVAVRINTVRQYAFEALTWLLRSTTVPTAVHDVMWWFCNAMERFSHGAQLLVAVDDNKENAVINHITPRVFTTPASTSVICPGGRSARSSRSAFHAFLGSVSALASSLPPSSAAGLQAVRCWSLNYSPYDRAFLHRSQVFSVISKILSHSEDNAFEDGMVGAIQESYDSFLVKENYIWSCPDVTSWCDITVSSRQGMAGALTDGSTETFWESGDEDRNKAKWIQITFPGGNSEDRPFIVCVHIDNIRDPMNKTLLVSFLYSGGSSDLVHMQDMEVDTKVASWICFTLPKVISTSVRVRCELRGPEPAVRVRQIRVLSPPSVQRINASSPAQVLQSLSETDSLRVFRLLTSEVFGKLLEWEHSNIESWGEKTAVAPVEDVPAADDNDLREHVVGILFAGHKLTSLQCQVMSHIVSAIGSEATRVRDDWETALLCAEVVEINHEELHEKLVLHQQDNYCFEMLSLLLALSGSAVGRAHLAQRTELLGDLLSLLHTGSERVQRQVISLLRRMIMELPPKKMLAAVNYGSELNKRITLLDHLVCYLGKAITVQMKVKGSGASLPASLTLGRSVTQGDPATWFMRGETTIKHAHIVTKLLTDMAEDKVTLEWGQETRTALAAYVVAVAHVDEGERRPASCIAEPTVWMALAALCVCEQSHVELTGDGSEARSRDSNVRPYCVNHDDGTTAAVIECRSCGLLCAECDRFLHLNRSTRTHHRQICKEEESTIRIDIHEGCGRAKLFWLLLLVDRRSLKALVEFRGMESVTDTNAGEGASRMSGPPGLAGICRFCGARDNTGLLAIGNVCADQQCQEHSLDACSRLLGCGHVCGGVRGERNCLPCLFGCYAGATNDGTPLRQDADDMCMICFTDPLQAAPAIQLSCGHVFHLHCCKKVLANKWNGPRITFSFSQCPICKDDINHWTLDDLLTPVRRLRDEVKRKALMRLEYEGLATHGSTKPRAVQDPTSYAMDRYAYYVCYRCEKAYFGGLARCEAEMNGAWDPAELVCGACSDIAGARTCPKHGADFLEYKCRYCCSVAVFFCFGTSHFCNACHDDFQRITNMPRHLLPQCPAGPKGEQLPGTSEECPLHVQHPPTGEEFALGCGVCRNAQSF